jgi:ABC-type nitrate/sulfonate/bicarbonate transport system substrate-binding protein
MKLLSVFCAIGLVATACASNPGQGAPSATAGSQPPPVVTLKFVSATPTVILSAVVLGVESGIFKDLGLNVEVTTGVGGNSINLVAAGQADLGVGAIPNIVNVSSQGKQMSLIYGTAGWGLGTILVARDGLKTLDDVKALPKCTFATVTPGTANYGHASYLNKALGLNCELVTFQTSTLQGGAVAAGRTDVAATIYDALGAAIKQGKVKILVDGRVPADQKHLGPKFTEQALYGLKSNLESKREAIVRFMRGMAKVNDLMQTSSTSQLVSLFRKNNDFQLQDAGILTESTENSLAFMNPNKGYVTKADWTAAVGEFATWGIPDFNGNSASWAYDAAVDMSFFEAGVGKP